MSCQQNPVPKTSVLATARVAFRNACNRYNASCCRRAPCMARLPLSISHRFIHCRALMAQEIVEDTWAPHAPESDGCGLTRLGQRHEVRNLFGPGLGCSHLLSGGSAAVCGCRFFGLHSWIYRFVAALFGAARTCTVGEQQIFCLADKHEQERVSSLCLPAQPCCALSSGQCCS